MFSLIIFNCFLVLLPGSDPQAAVKMASEKIAKMTLAALCMGLLFSCIAKLPTLPVLIMYAK
jgi:hypothetical protein